VTPSLRTMEGAMSHDRLLVQSQLRAKPSPGRCFGNLILELKNVKMSMRYTWRGGINSAADSITLDLRNTAL
jgi:hypothetical protein